MDIAIGLTVLIWVVFAYSSWDSFRRTYQGEAMFGTVILFLFAAVSTGGIWLGYALAHWWVGG